MSLPIIMHVNYCEQGQTIEEICRKAVAWGFDGVEFRAKRNGVDENVEDYLDAIARGVSFSGLKYVLFGCNADLMSSDKGKREGEIQRVLNFYKLASERFKLTVCNVFSGTLLNPAKSVSYSEYDRNGSFAASEDQWKWAAEGYKAIGELAEKLGFRLAFETHMCYIHDLPAAARKLVDMINSPAVGVNLDYGNTVYFKPTPSLADSIDILGDKLFYVHLKNSIGLKDGSRFPVGLGEGEINHRQYLKLLKDKGYNGPLCVEAPRPGDREHYAKQDIAYIKSLIEDIGW